MFNRLKLWWYRVVVCRAHGHAYKDARGRRLYFCRRCGQTDPGILIASDTRLLDLFKKPE